MRGALAMLVAITGCVTSGTHICEQGTEYERTCAHEDACDDVHHLCVGEAEREACAGKSDGDDCTAGTSVVTDGTCDDGVCFAKRCGDGYITGDEVCEGDNLGDAVDCRSIGYYEPSPLTCNAACAFDVTQCLGYCGDGIVSPSHEQCDGTNLNGAVDCTSIGYYEVSPLSCTVGCAFDESKCLGFCGDGKVTPQHELCDGAPPAETCKSFGYGAGFLECKFCAGDLDGCQFFGWHSPTYVQDRASDIAGMTASDVYVAGERASLLHFDGAAWTPVDLASCGLASDAYFSQIRVVGAGDFWLGASSGGKATLVHKTAATCTKTQVDTGAGAITGAPTDIWVVSSSLVFATTFQGTYSFDGATWTQRDGAGAFHVFASGLNDIYVISGTNQLRHFAGSWSTVSLTNIDEVRVITGTSSSDVWIGGRTNNDYSRVLHFNGSIWSHVMPAGTTPTTSFQGNILALSLAGGRAVATSAFGDTYAYDGTSWAVLDNAGLYNPRVWLAPTGVLFGINQNEAQIHVFDGSTRVETPSMAGATQHLWAHRSNAVYAASGSSIWVFNGVSWTEEYRAQAVYDVWVDPATGTAFSVEANGLVQRDGANSYSLGNNGMTGDDLWGAASGDIWVASSTQLKHWNGSGVDAPCATCTTSVNVYDLWGANGSDIFAVGQAGTITHYNGSTWAPQTSGTTQSLNAVWGWAGTDVVAVGYGTVIHYNGATWSTLAYPLPHNLIGVWGTSLSDLFTSSSEGEVWHYDGTHWAPVASGSTVQVSAIMGAGDSVFWLGSGLSPAVFRLVRMNTW